jgi:hypothetical protein
MGKSFLSIPQKTQEKKLSKTFFWYEGRLIELLSHLKNKLPKKGAQMVLARPSLPSKP